MYFILLPAFQAFHFIMQMFGHEATKILDFVECFPNGAGKGKKMASECAAAGLEGFPTWFINGKVVPVILMVLRGCDMFLPLILSY
jgi:hypothetical protein